MNQTLILHAPAKPGKVSTLTDGTIKAEFYISRELPADEMTTLFTMAKQGDGWLLFSPNPIEIDAIPKDVAQVGFDGKTPSQRLYNTLYVRWMNLTNQAKPFDQYYRERMEAIITAAKEGLPDRL